MYCANLLDHFPGRFLTEIFEEMDRLPVGLFGEVLEAKAYRDAKRMTDAADTEEARQRLPTTKIFQLVRTIDLEQAAAELKRRTEQAK